MLLNHNRYVSQVETDDVVVSLRKDGIVHVYIKPNVHITVEVQLRMLEAYHQATDIPRPFVFEAGEFTSISKEARLNAVKLEEQSPIIATAIVVKNLGQRIIADYYYKFNKPKSPLKIFTRSEEAILWLNEEFLG